MKQESKKVVTPPWNRSKEHLSKPEHLKLFHTILLMVENDNSDRFKGYNWSKLKN
jgi:hypothetical protein